MANIIDNDSTPRLSMSPRLSMTPRFCVTPRFGLASWAYCKIFIDIILLPITAEPLLDMANGLMYFFDFVAMLTFFFLIALIITDIILQAKLINGLRKNMVENLTSYCKYTKILWVLMVLFVTTYTLISTTGVIRFVFWRLRRCEALVTNMNTMTAGTIFQTLMMWLVIKEIKKLTGEVNEGASSGGIRVLNFGFTITIETSRSEKVNVEDNNNTYTEATTEKAKLAV